MVECECGIVREVTTGKTHRVGKRGPAVFDVNTKAALGIVTYQICKFINLICLIEIFQPKKKKHYQV